MTERGCDGDRNPHAPSTTYRQSDLDAIASLQGEIARRIRNHGPLSFADYMAAALYHPQLGYYARRSDQVGRGGDFYTSVSAGPLFGTLLAHRLAQWWDEAPSSGTWRILELGAHDGRLAADILRELRSDRPAAFAAVEYAIIEPLPELRRAQHANLADFQDHLQIVSSAAELAPCPGVLLANEVLDALPCHLLESDGSDWQEMGVAVDEHDAFSWQPLGPAGDLARELPERPAGYRTEVRSGFADFLRPLLPLLPGGHSLWFDYGFERDDLYAADRHRGTLRTYARHRAAEDPLTAPGDKDITAHVDFTCFAHALRQLGARPEPPVRQSRYLTELAMPWLNRQEGRTDPAMQKLMRNFRSLTHPGHLGESFSVIEAALP